jgi:single-strand DNA-binding protein
MNINLTILGGNLTADPEMKYTSANLAICNFSIANNRKWKDKNTGQQQEEVSFFRCAAFGRTAETISQYFRKGSAIVIEGRLKQDRWQDRDTGANRSEVKIDVTSFHFVGSKNDSQQEQPRPQDTYTNTPPAQSPDTGESNFEDDGVPF